jgi:hypothetical protein
VSALPRLLTLLALPPSGTEPHAERIASSAASTPTSSRWRRTSHANTSTGALAASVRMPTILLFFYQRIPIQLLLSPSHAFATHPAIKK